MLLGERRYHMDVVGHDHHHMYPPLPKRLIRRNTLQQRFRSPTGTQLVVLAVLCIDRDKIAFAIPHPTRYFMRQFLAG